MLCRARETNGEVVAGVNGNFHTVCKTNVMDGYDWHKIPGATGNKSDVVWSLL